MLATLSRAYAGIGNRDTPEFYLSKMRKIAALMELRGYVLRSGGADGADTAFYDGLVNKANSEVFVPWDGFNNNLIKANIPPEAFRIAENFVRNFQDIPQSVQKLFARNVQQVLGKNLDSPSEFIICYTRDGYTGPNDRSFHTGGTKVAIDIAASMNIPVFNLKRTDHHNKVVNYFNDDYVL
jgi:hypothetical protein